MKKLKKRKKYMNLRIYIFISFTHSLSENLQSEFVSVSELSQSHKKCTASEVAILFFPALINEMAP